jgi:ABC-2 type transport system permease protein
MTGDSKVRVPISPIFPIFPIFPISSLSSCLWKAWVFFKRDLVTDLSYRLSFALEAIHIVITVAAYYFWASLLGSKKLDGYDSFPFIIVGLTVNAYMTTCFVCFAQAIRGSQLTGTLKAVLTTSTSPAEFLVFSSGYPFARATLDAIAYAFGGLVFGLSLAQGNVIAAALIFAASILAFSSIGLISATFTLLFKRGDPLLWLFGSSSWLLGGVMYPNSVLPSPLRHFAKLLPITHAVKGLRAAVLSRASVADILPEVGALTLFAIVGLPLSLAAFKIGLARAKIAGTLGHQ